MKTLENKNSLPMGKPAKIESLAFLNNEVRQLVLQYGEIGTYKKNQSLFHQGDPVQAIYIVISGAVKLVRNHISESKLHTEKTLVEIIGPADSIGAALILGDSAPTTYPISALAIIESDVLKISVDNFNKHLKTNEHFKNYILSQTVKRMNRLQNDRCLQRMSAEKKLAYFLTEKVYSIPGLKISRQDIADGIGLAAESVIRLLTSWETQGLIAKESTGIKILEIEKLRALWET